MSPSDLDNPDSGGHAAPLRLHAVPCPRCGATDTALVFKGRDYLYGVAGEFCVSECRACGLRHQNPRPVPEDLARAYPDSYTPHAPVAPAAEGLPVNDRWASFLRRKKGYAHLTERPCPARDWKSWRVFDPLWSWRTGVRLIPGFVPNGRLLEIGCAGGAQLMFFRRLGWEHLHGIELVRPVAEAARALGFAVECGAVEEMLENFPDGHFDVVYSTMVMEHMTDPFRVIDLVARKLKPRGEFLFSTVVRDALDARLFGPYWLHYDLPRHMVYFLKSDLRAALKGRFTDTRCWHQSAPQDFTWAATFRTREGKKHVFDRLVLALGRDGRLAQRAYQALAWARLTSRVSWRCFRQS